MAILTLALVACADEKTAPDTGSVDSAIAEVGPSSDTGVGDGAKDGRPPDSPLPDGPLSDSPRVDAARDVGTSDTRAADLASDVFVPPTAACASGSRRFSYTPTMAVCRGAKSTQCEAAKLCAKTWHLCTVTEFLARGGRTINPGLADDAWLAGCTRSGTLHAPKDGICSSCVRAGSSFTAVGWSCKDGSTTLSMSSVVLGVTNAQNCRRLGVNSAANAARWRARNVDDDSDSAMCCY